MVDPTAIVVAVIGALAAVLAPLAKLWWDRRQPKDPVSRGQAEVALAQASLGIVTSSRDALIGDVARLTARVSQLEADRATDREHSAEQDRAIARLERTLRGWVRWYEDLRHRWEHHRAQGHPPPAPHPDHDNNNGNPA